MVFLTISSIELPIFFILSSINFVALEISCFNASAAAAIAFSAALSASLARSITLFAKFDIVLITDLKNFLKRRIVF